MERFIPRYDESDEQYYEHLQNDPEWNRIYAFLRPGYWHVTSLQGWDAIRLSEAIMSNLSGRFESRFADISSRSYAYKYELVALFDFLTPNEREVTCQWGNTWDVLVNDTADQILLQLDRGRLEQKVIPNSEAWGRRDRKVLGGCIPFVEVCYPEEISTESILSTYRIPATHAFEFLPNRIKPEAM